ncbi:MAG: tRNA pseudouridine(38-40) synthase TruA [Planctomycetales bacterium 71-10]|nr:MAG: tRNA pseudouridine(38-40) synthase TruA [Planctomycetales bacterium 71-10]
MRNIKLTIAYDGTDFHGWQRQPGLRTVQSVLDEAIGRLTGAAPNTNASGRTDAGVHAIGQVVHFLTAARHEPAVYVRALNNMLPRDVRIREAAEVPQAFHATLDARSKRYRYRIDNDQYASPFELRHAWHVFHRLDVDAMNRAGSALLGRHDFRSFETDWPNRLSSVRTIYDVEATRHGDVVHLEVEADGFLYNMVRAIAGTLMMVGAGKRPESWVGEVLRAEDRVVAGPNAPARGLFLLRVNYDRTPEVRAPSP